MARLTTLKPRVQAIGNRLPVLVPGSMRVVARISGRARQEARKRIWLLNPCCAMCGRLTFFPHGFDLDHIEPLDKGGSNDDYNLQVLCNGPDGCHTIKTKLDGGSDWSRKVAPGLEQDRINRLLHPSTLRPSAIPLTIVCGPAGGGKSTYIKQHAAPDDIIIDMDMIRVELGIGPDHWDTGTLERSLTRRNEMLAALATASSGKAWFIVSAATEQERTWWAAMLKPERTLIVMAPAKTCIQRIKATRTGERASRAVKATVKWWTNYLPDDKSIEVKTD